MTRLSTLVVRAWRPVLLAGALACALPGAVPGSVTLEARQVADGQVKAAFLFNLAKFVQWPTPGAGPLVIGVAGDHTFADVVGQTVLGRNVDGRAFETRRLASGDDPSGCAIVFIGAMHSRDEDDWLQRIRGPVLTVGESAHFLRTAGMVRLYVEDRRVRFQVNQKSAEAAGLKISSQLLMLAAR
jgi:hypothetical protein